MKFKRAVAAAGLKHHEGKQGIKGTYRTKISAKKSAITGSIDIDTEFEKSEPESNRWDYGLGLSLASEYMVWIEPHPAGSPKEIEVIVRKYQWLMQKLASPEFAQLRELTEEAVKCDIKAYWWVYDGISSFRSGGKEAKRLAMAGLTLPVRAVVLP